MVSASVGNGIAILGPDATGTSAVVAGTVSTYGTSAAIVIDPAVNAIVTTPVKSLEIGLYTTDGHTMADTRRSRLQLLQPRHCHGTAR